MSRLTGLAFPVRKQPFGYFASKGPLDVVWSDLIQAVFTPVGTQPMNRSYGGSVHLYLMDPQDGITADNIILSIRAAAARHAPGVVVESVEVSFLPAVINVTVTLRLEGDPQPSERVLTVPLTTYNLYGGTR